MVLSWKNQGAEQKNGATTKKTIGDENAVKNGDFTNQFNFRHPTYMNVWLASAVCCTCPR